MRDKFLTRATSWAVALTALSAIVPAALGAGRAAFGVTVGAAWMYLNLVALFYVVGAAFGSRTPGASRRVAWLLVLKFPVLYVAGFFLLTLRVFPVESLLVGLTASLAPFAALGMRRAVPRPAGKECC